MKSFVLFVVLSVYWLPVTECIECMSCYSNESGEENMAECEAGTVVQGQEMSLDCEANGWGPECITRLYRKWDEEGELEQLWLRTCVGVQMTCEEGMEQLDSGIELWTHCCDDGDHCNNVNPMDVITTDPPTPEPTPIQCIGCYSSGNGENLEPECEAGEMLQDFTVDCAIEGWSNQCITRLYRRDVDGEMEELWLRSCVGTLMTCDQGLEILDGGIELWTHCCDDGDNCNSVDPRDVVTTDPPTQEPTPSGGIQCMSCFSDESGEDNQAECEAGTIIPELSMDCVAEGWASSCITRLYISGDDDEQLWLRSCLGVSMTCEQGLQEFDNDIQIYTHCCDDGDNCNNIDPREVVTTEEPTLSGGIMCMGCFSGGTGEEGEAECEAGESEDTLDCTAEGWGAGCITRYYVKGEGEDLEELWLRSCVGAQMTCEQGLEEFDTGIQIWTHCCDDSDNCNNVDPRDVITTDPPTPEPTNSPTNPPTDPPTGGTTADPNGSQTITSKSFLILLAFFFLLVVKV